jgi:PASTA domain-containing protein/putative Ig domain-containing protein
MTKVGGLPTSRCSKEMSDQATIPVPDVVGLTQPEAEAKLKSAGLVVGSVTRASSATTPVGSVSSAIPATGAPVSPGSSVNLEVSSGLAQVAVPDVVGFTELAAETMLRSVGLTVDTVTKTSSNAVPAGGVISTNPPAGTLVSRASNVNLEVSTGQQTDRWAAAVQYATTAVFVVLGGVVLWIIVKGVYGNAGFLTNLANKEVARGLITFLVAITTVGIAVILAISTIILKGGDDDDKRFDRGKQVLTTLIGVLGTIVGFYFGSAIERPQTLAITPITLPAGAASTAYPSTALQATGGTPPLKWSVTPALPPSLTLDPATGTISGTPTAVLPKTKFTFTVTDSAKPAASSTADLTLEIK